MNVPCTIEYLNLIHIILVLRTQRRHKPGWQPRSLYTDCTGPDTGLTVEEFVRVGTPSSLRAGRRTHRGEFVRVRLPVASEWGV